MLWAKNVVHVVSKECRSCCEQRVSFMLWAKSVVHVCSRFIMSTKCVCNVNNCRCFSLLVSCLCTTFASCLCDMRWLHTVLYTVCLLQHCDSHMIVLCSAHCNNLTASWQLTVLISQYLRQLSWALIKLPCRAQAHNSNRTADNDLINFT